jgi:hypothetical protein
MNGVFATQDGASLMKEILVGVRSRSDENLPGFFG